MAETLEHNELIDSNQGALSEAGLELNAPPELDEFVEAIDRVKGISKVRTRLKIKSRTLTSDQQEALSGAMDILDEIDAIEDEDAKETAFFDFKAAYWELILTPEETALFREQVDDHLDQLGGEEAPDELPYDEFMEVNDLPEPSELAQDVKDMLSDPDYNYQDSGDNGYLVRLSQNKKKLVIEIRASKDHPGEGPSVNWGTYQGDIAEALTELDIPYEMEENDGTEIEKKRGITQYIVLADEYDAFVEPKIGERRREKEPEPGVVAAPETFNMEDDVKENDGFDMFADVNKNLDEDGDGVPDSIDAEVHPFLEGAGLYKPEDLAQLVRELLEDANRTTETFGTDPYEVLIEKKKNQLLLTMRIKGDNELEIPEAWAEYRKDTESAIRNIGITPYSVVEIGENENELLGTTIMIRDEDYEGFVAPKEEEGEEPDDLLNEDGLIDIEDGDAIPPGASIRIDGSLPPGKRIAEAVKGLREAASKGDIGGAFSKLFELFGAAFPALMESWKGTEWDSIVDGLEWEDGLTSGEPSNISELYELGGGKLTKLKYTSFDSITTNVSNPGDRVAAAALLGVVQNLDVDRPSENHCSGWVDTIARKAGLASRYNLKQCVMVNPKYSQSVAPNPNPKERYTRYRGWRQNAKNEKSHIDQIGGLKPGDMVIEFNDNNATGFHDEVVIDVKNGKMLVASQNTSKNGTGKRSLQWKTINPDTIATVTRPS